MKAKHTPGPWRVTRDAEVIAIKGGYICCVGDQERKATAVDRANARLIAAAPVMLEALISIRHLNANAYGNSKFHRMTVKLCEDAISTLADASQPPTHTSSCRAQHPAGPSDSGSRKESRS